MASCSAYDCTLPSNGPVGFEGDPDIAGIGNVIAWMLSSWLPFICVFIPHLRLYTKRLNLDNPPDLNLKPEFSAKYQELVLALSDSQLVAGLTMLLVGFVKHCEITQYHFAIINCLGEISFATHQSTYLILYDYFSSRTTRSWLRFFLITALIVLIGVSQLVQQNFLFLSVWGLPTQCIWDNMSGNYDVGRVAHLVFYMILLFWGYVDILRCLVVHVDRSKPPATTRVSVLLFLLLQLLSLPGHMRIIAEEAAAKQRNQWSSYCWKILSWLSLAAFSFLLCLKRIIPITNFRLIRTAVFLYLGTVQLFKLRSGAALHGRKNSEDDWGFGQLVALLLLILPILALVDAYSELHSRAISNLESQRSDSGSRHSMPSISAEEPVVPLSSVTVGEASATLPIQLTQVTTSSSPSDPSGQTIIHRTSGGLDSSQGMSAEDAIESTRSPPVNKPPTLPERRKVVDKLVNLEHELVARAWFRKLEFGFFAILVVIEFSLPWFTGFEI